jgi:hypothetical protein
MKARRLVKPLALGVLAVIVVAALATSRRLFAYLRNAVMHRHDNDIMDEDIQRFVNEGGTPVGAGAE